LLVAMVGNPSLYSLVPSPSVSMNPDTVTGVKGFFEEIPVVVGYPGRRPVHLLDLRVHTQEPGEFRGLSSDLPSCFTKIPQDLERTLKSAPLWSRADQLTRLRLHIETENGPKRSRHLAILSISMPVCASGAGDEQIRRLDAPVHDAGAVVGL